jgi:uncharacterized protein
MEFKAFGHKNVLSTHKSTVEFTSEDFLTLRGDCILAINAKFEVPIDLNGKIKIEIFVDDLKDEIIAEYNPDFDSDEMVIRKSTFLDKRTFAINASKAAIDIDRNIVNLLTDPKKQILIRINNC